MNNDLKEALNKISKIVFTNRCLLCGEVIELDEKLCDSCKGLERIQSPRCTLCGADKSKCKCKKHKNEYKAIAAPFYYKDSITLAVNRCKSNEMPFLAEQFAVEMADAVSEEFSEMSFDFITPVPLSRRSFFKRGYNQSELIAVKMAEILNLQYADLLVKTENTKPQKERTARERRVNLFGSFDVVDKDIVKGKTILLIDDVKTTGSTLNECSKMLKVYGAESVYCSTLAIVNNLK